MSNAFQISGLDAVIQRVEKLGKNTKERATKEFLAFGNNVARDAKANLQRGSGGHGPTSNTGKLAGSINVDSKDMSVSVTVATNYAAYIEFGTRKYAAKYVATLPQDWQTYAATFKGKGGGTFEQMIESLIQWVKDRGIGPGKDPETGRTKRIGKQSAKTTREADAYAIALHILRNGIRAQPYLYPAIEKNKPDLIKQLKKIIS